MSEQYFRILSIDGGGAKGVIPARIINNIDNYLKNKDTSNNIDNYLKNKDTSNNIISNFDLIAGTSTGGIIALGLSLGLETSLIVKLYEELVPVVFKNNWGGWLRNKYDSLELKKSLEKYFGDYKLSDLKADVLITSLSLQNSNARLYKTDYFERNKPREDEKIVDVAMSSSAAPTYFNAYSPELSSYLIDGGMCANNPSMLALIDAIDFIRPSKSGGRILQGQFHEKISNLVTLSIGTGLQSVMPYDYKKLINAGKLNWAKHIFFIVTDSQSKIVDYQLNALLKDRYIRFNPKITFKTDLDDINAIEYSKNLSDITSELETWLNNYL